MFCTKFAPSYGLHLKVLKATAAVAAAARLPPRLAPESLPTL